MSKRKKLEFRLIAVIVMAFLCCDLFLTGSARANTFKWSNITIIRHACGGIDGMAYTNSKEALEQSILSGCGAVEIDFRFSSDGVLVCAHDWDDIGLKKAPKAKAFKNHKINGIFTTMTAETALKKLAGTKIFLIVDTKEKDTASVYKEIDRILSSIKGGTKYKKKIVPQIYSQDEYDILNEIYSYKRWILTLYKLKPSSAAEYKELAEFCMEKGIKTVTIPKNKVTAKRVSYFTDKGIRVATHTVNGEEEWSRLEGLGVAVFYTDFGRNATD